MKRKELKRLHELALVIEEHVMDHHKAMEKELIDNGDFSYTWKPCINANLNHTENT